MCELDFSDCDDPGLDTSAGPGDDDDAAEDEGDVSSSGSGQVGEDGCACRTTGHAGPVGVGCLSLFLLALRRRKLAASIAVGMLSPGCGPGDESESSATTNATGSEEDRSSNSGGVDGWPELWRGEWYDTEMVVLGEPTVSDPYFHYFFNIEIGTDSVRLDYFNSTGEEEGSEVFQPAFEVDGLSIDPVEGADHIEWPPAAEGRARALIRPGPDCSELELEMVFTAVDMPHITTLRRGQLCLVTTCDPDDGIQCQVTVDLCTDDPVSTMCES